MSIPVQITKYIISGNTYQLPSAKYVKKNNEYIYYVFILKKTIEKDHAVQIMKKKT